MHEALDTIWENPTKRLRTGTENNKDELSMKKG